MLPEHIFWITSRAAGTAALLLSSLAVCAGLLMGGKLVRGRQDLRHLLESLSLASVSALAVHAVALLGDSYLSPSLADITIPDCDHAHRGETVTKIWRFKNAGTRPWVGYTLHRLDLPQGRDQCQTISDLTIPDTRPGELVDVKTEVSVPNRSGFCFVRFKMMDGDGKVAFPGGRPVNFQLIVD